MIIFKTIVPDKQVQDYVRPEGTKKYECGAGINCAFCTLKMLGVYNDELEETSKTCGPRYRSGKVIQPQEYLSIAKQVIADMTEEHHELELAYEYGQPSTSLAKIVSLLHPGEACFFVYGRTGVGGHAVVLRKNQDGVVELVDPQRGSDDIGKEYGFSPAQVAELGIKATPQYYRVQGIPAIEEAMIEQSVLFKYWNSKKELLEDLPNFVVGALMIDSVAGLKMLIDDPASGALATKMEEDEEYPPPPHAKSMEMEVDMQGGAIKTLPPETFGQLWREHNEAIEKEMDIIIGKIGVNAAEERNKALRLKEAFLERINKVSWKDSEDIKLGPTEFIHRFFQLGPAEIGAILSVKGELPEDADYYEAEEEGEDEEESEDGSAETGSTGSKATVRKYYETITPISQCKKAEVLGANVTDYCYICGFEIKDKKNPKYKKKAPHRTRECEHILPAFTALGHGGLITKSSENDSTDPNIGAIFKTEYANSHRCCNQIKSASIWIKYDPTRPFSLVVDRKELSKVLRKIQNSDKYDCKEVFDKPLAKGWADRRADVIEKDVLTPLIQNIMNNMDPEPELYYARFRYRQVKSIAGLTPNVLASVFLGTGDAAKLASDALEQVRKSQKRYTAAAIGPRLKELLIPDILRLSFQETFRTMTVGISFDDILDKLRLRNPNMRAPRNLEKYLFDLLDKKKIAAIVTSAITKLGSTALNEDDTTKLVNKTGTEISSAIIEQLKGILGPIELISEAGVIVVEDENITAKRQIGGGGDEDLGYLDDAFDSLIGGVKEDIAEADVDLAAWLASPAYLGTRSRGPAFEAEVGVGDTLVLPAGTSLPAGKVAKATAAAADSVSSRTRSNVAGKTGGHIDISVRRGGRHVIDVDI